MLEPDEPVKALNLLRTTSLTGVVERELEQMILSGKLKPGERLNEIQLSNRFGTSRGPLREAMRSLQAKGLVFFIRNRGVFVAEISIEEALEIYDLRAALFGLAGRLLSDLATDALLDQLEGFITRMDAAVEARDFDQYYPINLAFHDFLIKSTGNKTLEREYHSFVHKLHLCRTRGLVQAGGLLVSNREHREMVDAVASGQRERAHEAFFRHVERSKSRFHSTVTSEEK
ncbi:FCD domain-containing protein [Alkalilacustris brevis]|uniref:FCD domain-containing protein n=1 Tax=Alkalilacustris brevis TaxID=2026338 RepID=UPI000E0DB9C9|nr:FCD domain-containing protein [Alkalilacustris brevis]